MLLDHFFPLLGGIPETSSKRAHFALLWRLIPEISLKKSSFCPIMEANTGDIPQKTLILPYYGYMDGYKPQSMGLFEGVLPKTNNR